MVHNSFKFYKTESFPQVSIVCTFNGKKVITLFVSGQAGKQIIQLFDSATNIDRMKIMEVQGHVCTPLGLCYQPSDF